MLNQFYEIDRATDWLIKFVIPFVNTKSQISLRKIWPEIFTEAKKFQTMNAKAEEDLKGADLFKAVADSQVFIEKMLFLTLLQRNNTELSEELRDNIPAIEKRIKSHFPPVDLKIQWSGQGQCFAAIPQTLVRNDAEMVERIMVHAIIRSLYSLLHIKGQGFEKIGLCKNCWIVFEKKRKDQEYCSAKCKGTALKRKSRQAK